MDVRLRQEEIERNILSPYATLSAESRGRRYPLEPCAIRTEFQRDRDKIIHSKAFRRLKHKTQVFITPEGDHYRTRLTHTLEVAQIGRTIARALRLNEDLTEAIALGHDLGHTPFGHEGERALDRVSSLGFRHNEQSLRVVEVLENSTGLNLTEEVRDGILCHTGNKKPSTPEGEIICLADKIAYINHDIDDAIRGGIIQAESLPGECVAILGVSHGRRIDTMVQDVVKNSMDKPHVSMSRPVQDAMMKLRAFMFEAVYIGSEAKAEEKKAGDMIASLFFFFMENYNLLPGCSGAEGEGKEREIMDYIAGMTDTFATQTFKEHFIPKGWYR
ncbi:MAG: deoxyguanosinetriphosphate triphosphohydrolase [Ruminococcaceae bacterium]|nr:deoxyguanosinetriphosphate triphosphohydrolase [Oscillospiraceae bacterium]